MKRSFKFLFLAALAGCTFTVFGTGSATLATVSELAIHQQWPWSPKVLVAFTLSGLETMTSVDVTLSGVVGGNKVEIPPTAIKGATKGLMAGQHVLTFDPTVVPAFGTKKSIADFRLLVTPAASAINPSTPLYMIVDLENQNSVQYLSRADILSGDYGTYERAPAWIQGTAALEDCLIWTGVTNDVYKTTKLVLRRIPAGTSMLGAPEGELGRMGTEHIHEVTLTKDYWIGVYELTQKQYQLITGETPAFSKGDMRPVERVSYNTIRGSEIGAGWPETSGVDEASFIAKIRAKTGIAGFDLPTEAQWEYACRAGTTTSLNSGKSATTNLEDTECPNMNELGRYMANGGFFTKNQTESLYHAEVGSYKPNAWGLYDMHGNVYEWCLDWGDWNPSTPQTDPKGPDLETNTASPYKGKRASRGGVYRWAPTECRSATRSLVPPSESSDTRGLRLACSMEVE